MTKKELSWLAKQVVECMAVKSALERDVFDIAFTDDNGDVDDNITVYDIVEEALSQHLGVIEDE